jgi:hypothetical protein
MNVINSKSARSTWKGPDQCGKGVKGRMDMSLGGYMNGWVNGWMKGVSFRYQFNLF